MAPEDQDVTPEEQDVTTVPTPSEPTPPPELASPRKRTGLIVVVGALLLLLVAGVAGAGQLISLSRRTVGGDAGSSKPRIEAAIEFMKTAIVPNNIGAVKPFLTDDAQNAITASQWAEVASATAGDVVPTTTFSATEWTNDTTASVSYESDVTTGTMLFAPSPDQPDVVVLTDVVPDGPMVYDIALVAAGSDWRVVSYTPRQDKFFLDATWVKSLLDSLQPPVDGSVGTEVPAP
jgi:hypothetical protein